MSFEDGPGSQPPARSHLLHFLPLVPDKDSGIDSGSSTPLCSFTVLYTDLQFQFVSKTNPLRKERLACFASGYLHLKSFRFTATWRTLEGYDTTEPCMRACYRCHMAFDRPGSYI
jgi:hypothetical protein